MDGRIVGHSFQNGRLLHNGHDDKRTKRHPCGIGRPRPEHGLKGGYARKAVQKHHDERNHQVVGEFQGVSHDAPQRDGQKYFDVPSECFGFRKQKKGKGQKNVDGPFNIGHTTG